MTIFYPQERKVRYLSKVRRYSPGITTCLKRTKKSFNKDGYFKTGDLGMLTLTGELKITGRIKDIIVLANGENIDPSRIESAITMLPFVKDAVSWGRIKRA